MQNEKKNDKKKNGFFKDLYMKLLALAIAFLVWLIVMNISDYSITRTIRNIEVIEINGDTIEELGKVYDVTDGDTIDVIVKGPRSVVDTISAADFAAVADLSKMSITNTVQIQVSITSSVKASQVTFTTVDDMLSLSIEDKTSVDLPVKIVTTGEVADGYALGSASVTPNIVTVEGPASVISKITEVRAVVSVANRTESFTETVSPSCFDAYGESMTGKNIAFSVEEVTVNLPVNPTKEVPVIVSTRGEPKEGYQVTDILYNPQKVLISGEEDLIKEISSIRINDISVDGISENMEKNVDVEDYLPNDIYLADTNDEIAVSITVEAEVKKTISVQLSDIELLNANENYTYTLTVPTGYQVVATGLAEYVDSLNAAKISPKLDVAEYQPGTHLLQVEYLESSDYKLTNSMRVTLVITEKEETAEEDSEESSTEEEDTEKTSQERITIKTTEQKTTE